MGVPACRISPSAVTSGLHEGSSRAHVLPKAASPPRPLPRGKPRGVAANLGAVAARVHLAAMATADKPGAKPPAEARAWEAGADLEAVAEAAAGN